MLVPNLRVNVSVPFPATVTGSGPIVISKAQGIWTVALNVVNLVTATPSGPDLPNTYTLCYNATLGIFEKVSLSAFGNIIGTPTPHQRLVTTAPVIVLSDQLINCNFSAPTTIALPTAVSRSGAPLTFKDVGGNWGSNNVTFAPNGGDTIDGRANLVAATNHQSVTLTPANDGTTTGWLIT